MASTEFSLDKKIGTGSFGDVYSGTSRITGEKLAIKRVKKQILYQYGNYLINAFWKEIDSMRKCDCANSVRLIKTFETTNNFNIIMELCDSDLLCYLNNRPKPFTVEEVRETFQQLNNVFKIMTKHNIIHRDLKLGNILIKYTDNSKQKFIPKLSDYGFSKDLNNQAFTGTHLGTPATMAPEIMMDLKYNDKSDLWSIGVMMYQLHFKEIPYPGFNEQEILKKIKNNFPRKQPSDPQLRDLLNKLLVMNPNNRISWEEYFNHPFFRGNNSNLVNAENCRYIKISDFKFGFNCDKELFQCYIAQDSRSQNKKVIIKSYNSEFINNNNQLFSEEVGLFKAFNGNQNVLKLIDFYKENNRTNLVFEYVNCEMLYFYAQTKEFSEKDIKKLNKALYENIFVFNACNFMPFIFISVHSFCLDKNENPIIFDFGFHRLLLSNEEISSYFLPNQSKINNNKNRIKTNVMNYGITLLKLLCGNNFAIKDKEIVLPQNKILSDEFNTFISKCLYKNINKRFSWLQLGEDNFILGNNIEMSNIVGNNALLGNDKLEIIFDSLKNKFEFIIKYYENFEIEKNKEYIQQIESFMVITLFEMKIIFNFFNRNIYEKPFTSQHEISFISINDDCKINKINLNLVNPLLKDIKIIDMNNNKIINDFLVKLKQYIKQLEKISAKIHSFLKNSIINGNFKEFLINLMNNFENSKIQEYFFNVIKNAENEKNNENSYKELCLGEYLCEFILFVKTILYDNQEEIHFNKQSFIKKFFDIFGEEKNKIEISVINLKEIKKNYVLVSFLPILFKCYKNTDMIDRQQLERNKQSIDGLVRYYPILMNKIVLLKKR